jgi:hypothetical protein
MEKEITLVLNYLDKIGEKLGIGANMLWPYLLKQQMIEGIVSLCLVLLLFTICFLTWRKYVVNPQRHEAIWVDGMYFYIITTGVTALFGVMSLAHFLFHGLFQLVNTEYMAFRVLVGLLKQVR